MKASARSPHYPTKYKIRLIDFGFMCIRIKCKDGKSISIGHYYNDTQKMQCNNPYSDIIQFILSLIIYNKK